MIMFVVYEICWVSIRIWLLADLLGTIRWGRFRHMGGSTVETPRKHLWHDNGLIANMKPRAFPWKTGGVALGYFPEPTLSTEEKVLGTDWVTTVFRTFVPVIQTLDNGLFAADILGMTFHSRSKLAIPNPSSSSDQKNQAPFNANSQQKESQN